MTSASLIEKIENAGLNVEMVEDRVLKALAEDAHDGDITSLATVSADQKSVARFTARKSGVVAGVLVAAAVLEACGINEYEIVKQDGAKVSAGDVIVNCSGNTRSILVAERTALNFLTHLSGIATLTATWMEAIADTKAKVRDTRKTIPGLRELEKYAVRVGGGTNHRMSLNDGALIKDNHIASVGSLALAVERVRKEFPGTEIEVEADTIEQVNEALALKVELILLDNMTISQTKEAVVLASGSGTRLESSGGLTLESAAEYAATGVDFLAVGSLTHSAPALDIGLDF
jgi:nicotinate-nucleotide pyrophosphorylase (carboxylating)